MERKAKGELIEIERREGGQGIEITQERGLRDLVKHLCWSSMLSHWETCRPHVTTCIPQRRTGEERRGKLKREYGMVKRGYGEREDLKRRRDTESESEVLYCKN